MSGSSRNSTLGRVTTAHGFTVALVITLLYLALRNTGPYPLVFADEWLYSKFARLTPLGESQLPSYLYLGLYGWTNACGAGFLQCTRLLNVAFFIAAAPFIYLVARTLLPRPAAAVLAVLSMLSPINGYTAYFMPEAMYYFGFWALSWVLLRPGLHATLALGAGAGVLLGLLSLIKVHALFLLPALCLYLVYAAWAASGRQGLAQGVLAAVAALALTIATKLGVAYLLAGKPGLSLFGTFYGGHVNNSDHGLLHLLPPALHNFYGHAMALAVLFGFPLLAFAAAAACRGMRAAVGVQGRTLLLYTVLMLGSALGMTVAYTASIANAGPLEGSRLHLRYYDFAFPLLLLAGAACMAQATKMSARLRCLLAGGMAVLVAFAALRLLPAYVSSLIDCPEVFTLLDSQGRFGHGSTRPASALLVSLEIGLLLWWAWRPQQAARAFLYGLLPLMMLCSEIGTTVVFQRAQAGNEYDAAGAAVRAVLTPRQRDDVAIAGSDLAGLARAQFHIDSPRATTIELPADAPFDAMLAPADKRWLLVVGKHALSPEWKPALATPDYALIPVTGAGAMLYQLEFGQPRNNPALERIEGLHDAEDWGSWSSGKTVTLHFAQPLPARATLVLEGRAFGPNAGKEFVLQAGSTTLPFKLQAGPQQLLLKLDTDGRQRQLTITVPQPASPLALGMGNDQRTLGLGLTRLAVGETPPSP